jgi:hypothetical protein
MAINEDLLISGATGLTSFAPVGTTLPTDTSSALDAAFKDFGAISSDGLTEAPSQTYQSFKPWGRTRKAKNTLTDSGKTFQLTFWETNPDVLAVYFGLDTVPTATAGAFDFAEPDTDSPVYRAMVADIIEGTNHIRIACTKVQRTDRGNIVYGPSNLIGYQMTFDQIGDVHRYYLLDALADAS